MKIKDWACEFCSKAFKTRQEVQAHTKRIHEKIKNFKCNSCEKTFVTGAELRIHDRLIHLKTKFTKCELCHKEISSNLSNMKKHIRMVHERVKSHHKCDICQKYFFSKTVLKTHKQSTHTDERNFECGTCKKTYKAFINSAT